MHESRIDEEQPSKTIGGHDVTTGPAEEERRLVKFDIGTFVHCHRKLCQLIKPFISCYDSFIHLTTWQHPSLTFVVMLVSVYFSIKHPAFLAVIPMVYSSIVLSLSGVRKLGSTAAKESLIMRKNKFQRKVDDVDLELKIAAMKQAREDLRDYIDICIEIQAVEATLCRHLETFYRICGWEEERLSKMFLIALLSACLFLFLFPGRYLFTMGIIGIFTGNSYFEKVSRQAFVKSHLMLEQLRNYMDIHLHKLQLYVLHVAGVKHSSKSWKGSQVADNDNNEEWFDAEQEMLTSDSESYEDDIEVDDDEDMPTTRRRAKLFSGLSVVTHLADYRKKQKRINSGNCASCDVSFSSLLKKRQYCRHCGDSFCSRCCSQRVKRAVFGATAPAAYEETVLVCKSCYGFLMNKREGQSTDIWYY